MRRGKSKLLRTFLIIQLDLPLENNLRSAKYLSTEGKRAEKNIEPQSAAGVLKHESNTRITEDESAGFVAKSQHDAYWLV